MSVNIRMVVIAILFCGGLAAEINAQGGKAYGQWASIEKGLVERVKERIEILEADKH